MPLLTLSYDRLVCVLWGYVKDLSARVEALEKKHSRVSKSVSKANAVQGSEESPPVPA